MREVRYKAYRMSIIINKLTIELYQKADNDVGSEHAEIIVNPVLIGLFNDKKEDDYYLTFKSESGFSFENKEEIIGMFTKIEKIINECR